MSGMDSSTHHLKIAVDTTDLERTVDLMQVGSTLAAAGPLPGRPWFTIASLLTTLAFVLTALASAALTVLGALPAGVPEAVGAAITIGAGVAGALALGLGGLGKAIYAYASMQVPAPLPLIEDASGDRLDGGIAPPPPLE